MYRSIWACFTHSFYHLKIQKASQNTKSCLSRPLSVLGQFWMHFWNVFIWPERLSGSQRTSCIWRRPSIFENSGIFSTFLVITKITIIFGQGFWTQVSGKFSVSFAKVSDIRKQGSCTGLVSKSESPKSPKYRENPKSKIFSQMHGLN